MLGGSTSKLAMLGSNLGNFISDFCPSAAGGIYLPFAHISLFSCTALMSVSCLFLTRLTIPSNSDCPPTADLYLSLISQTP